LKFAAALSSQHNVKDAVDNLKEQLTADGWELGRPADLACLFVSSHFKESCQELLDEIRGLVETRHLIGCTGESIIGGDQEIEQQPAVSLWLAEMPDVNVITFALSAGEIALGIELNDWPERLQVDSDDSPSFILLPEPYTSNAPHLLNSINESYPGCPAIGGIASAGGPGDNRLFFNDRVLEEGMAGAALTGDVVIETVVSQGCRPIGRPFVVTKVERNVVFELAGVATLEQFKEVYAELDENDQALVQTGLFLGQVVDEYREDFQRGDFLIRNVIGADHNTGSITVTDVIRVGQTVQFHVRDAETADEDLRELLSTERSASDDRSPGGALLFTCNGRGSRMFDTANHDAGAIQQIEGQIPLAGFFAAGEIGPIGDENFLHGYTASMVLFRPQTKTK